MNSKQLLPIVALLAVAGIFWRKRGQAARQPQVIGQVPSFLHPSR